MKAGFLPEIFLSNLRHWREEIKPSKFGGTLENPVLHKLQSARENTLSKWEKGKPTTEKGLYSKETYLS